MAVTSYELTAYDVKCTVCNERINIKILPSGLRQQFLHQDVALLNKDFNKYVKNSEVESWCDQLPVRVPLCS